jgi:hypothetical protein
MSPASRDPFSYLSVVVQVARGGGIKVGAHDLARKDAIFLKMSVSLFVVSSNPGVSMRTTCLSSRVNSFAS